MDELFSKDCHIIPPWDAYPRVRYFYRNLKCLVPRFKKLPGALVCFQDTSLNKKLDDLIEIFSSGVRVHMVSDHVIDRNNIIISSTGQETENTNIDPKINIVVWNFEVDDIQTFQIKEACVNALGFLHSQESGPSIYVSNVKPQDVDFYLLINCRITKDSPNADTEIFKEMLLGNLREFGINIPPANVTVGYEKDTKVAFSISNFLEALILKGFVQVNNHLGQYVSEKPHSAIIHGSQDSQIDYAYLHRQLTKLVTLGTLKDYYEISKTDTSADATMIDKTEGQSIDKGIFDEHQVISLNVVTSIAGILKSLLVPVLSERFNISASNCNSLLCELQFIDTLSNDIGDSIDLNQLYKARNELLLKFKEKLPKSMDKVEAYFSRAVKCTSKMRKMFYEVQCYLKQTVVDLEYQSCPKAPTISDKLREAIQSIEGVYSLGTFYGRLEIQLGSALSKDKMQSSAVVKQLKDLMMKHHFYHPWDVKYLIQEPRELSFDLEPGSEIMARLAKKPNRGTLGGYIVDKCRKVYALTCGHVVGFNDNVKVFGMKDNMPHPLSVKQHTFPSQREENEKFPFIDIAALQVLDRQQVDCRNYLTDKQHGVELVNVHKGIVEDLVGTKVCKISAMSGKTFGIISNVDLTIFPRKDGEYLMVIDPLHDRDEDPEPVTANAGDSNAGGIEQENENMMTDIAVGGIKNNTGNYPFTIVKQGTVDMVCELETPSEKQSINENSQNACRERMSESVTMNEDFQVYVLTQQKFYAGEDGVVAKRGDSGGIFCSSQLNGHIEESTAISMISAGEFSTSCGRKDACLSFKLHTGLEILQEQYSIFF
ncbi:hypothetical protein ACF0H5_005859 [Mactra antiquata]